MGLYANRLDGTCTFTVWNCLGDQPDNESNTIGPLAQDPNDKPSVADEDPFCAEITNAITLDGVRTTGVTQAHFAGYSFDRVVGRITACSGGSPLDCSCDLSATFSR
jgi:hypothetical protein